MKSLIVLARILVALLGLDEDDALVCWEFPATWRGSERYQHVCQIHFGNEDSPTISLAYGREGLSVVVFTESEGEG